MKKEYENEATSCRLVERDSSQVNQLRGADRQKEDEKHWWMNTYPLTRCSFLGQRTGGTGRSRHSAAMTTTAGLSWDGVWGADNVMSFFFFVGGCTRKHRLPRGHLPALLHLGMFRCCEKIRCCTLINIALTRKQHIHPAVVPDIKQFSHLLPQLFTHLYSR